MRTAKESLIERKRLVDAAAVFFLQCDDRLPVKRSIVA